VTRSLPHFFIATLFCGALLTPSLAHAGSQSWLTLGVGFEGGLSRHADQQGETVRELSTELTLRLRILRIFGVSMALNTHPEDAPDSGLTYSSRYRVTGILYLIPNRRVSLYAVFGLGARDILDVASFSGSTTTYHTGGGLEWYLGDHFALNMEYLWLIPGASAIEGEINARAEAWAEEQAAAAVSTAAGTVPMRANAPEINPIDFVDPGNFQLTVGVRYYF